MVAAIVGLLVMGVFLVLLEVVIPGGVVGTLGALCVVTAIVLAFFNLSLPWAIGITLGSIIFFIVAFYVWLTYLDRLPVAKRMFLKSTANDWSGTDEKNEDYLGKEGVTQTTLRPSGFAMIDGERVDVVTEGDMIEKGEKIKVIEVEGNRIVVAAVESDEA